MWSFRGVWFPTCNLNYMSNMFNDAMQGQRCLINSRWTIWTCRCLTTGFWHQKNKKWVAPLESEVFVWTAPFWDILSGKLEYQLWSQVVKLWNLQHVHPLPKWHFWSLEFCVFKGICNEQKNTYLRCLQKPLFFPRGGLFRLVKKTPGKTCGWFFGDISDGDY